MFQFETSDAFEQVELTISGYK